MQEPFDAYHKWLGIPPEEQPVNHYRLLGIKPFESDPDVISHAADRQMYHVRSFQNGPHAQQSQELMNALAAAKVCLLSPERKAEYDLRLRDELAAQTPEVPTPSPVVVPDVSVEPASEITLSARGRRGASRGAWPWRAVVGSLCVALAAVLLAWKFTRPGVFDPTGEVPPPRVEAKSPDPTPAKMIVPEVIAKQLQEGDVSLPNLPGAVDLIAAVDPATQADPQGWRKPPGGLLVSSRDKKYGTLTLPAEVPEEYMVALLVELVQGHDSLAIIVPMGGRQCAITLDGRGGKSSGIDEIDKTQYYKNATAYHEPLFQHGKTKAVVCLVRKSGIKVLAGPETIIEWHGQPGQLSKPYYWRTGGHKGLAIGSTKTEYRIYQMVVAPLPPEEEEEEEEQTKQEREKTRTGRSSLRQWQRGGIGARRRR